MVAPGAVLERFLTFCIQGCSEKLGRCRIKLAYLRWMAFTSQSFLDSAVRLVREFKVGNGEM